MKKTISKKLLIPLIALLLLAIPFAVHNDYYMLVINRLLVNIVVVLGLNFITGLTGQMNLGTAGIFALGAYASALVSKNLGVSPWLGLCAAIVMGVIIGFGLGYPSLRVKGVYLSLTTIGFSEVVRLLCSNLNHVTGGTQGLRQIPPFSVMGFQFDSQFRIYFLYLLFVLVAFFIAWRVTYSKWGRVFKSLRDNVEAVEMSGVNIAQVKITAFTLAAVFGAVGGSMYAHYMGYINPSSFNMDMSANFVIMLMVGGIGSVFGNIIGAVVVTALPELLRFLGTYYQLVFAIIILLGAIFTPNGWGDGIRRVWRRLIHRKEDKAVRRGGVLHE